MIDWFTTPFENVFYQRSLLAAILIGFTNGAMSSLVVLKKSALKVGSLSHTLLPGIALAIMLVGLTPASAFLGAMFAALIVALLSLMISRNSRIDQETALAVLYTAAFAGGILLLSRLSVAQQLESWLFGNITGLADADLWTVYAISGITLVVLSILKRPILVMLVEPNVAQSIGVPVRWLNYVIFALMTLVLISSLQAVGLILALGLLVAPGATIYLFSDSTEKMFWGGGLLGAICSALALVLAYWFDLPPGATIVVLLGGVFLLSFLLSPKYGLLQQFHRHAHQHSEH